MRTLRRATSRTPFAGTKLGITGESTVNRCAARAEPNTLAQANVRHCRRSVDYLESLLGEQVNHARSSASSSTAKVIVNSCGFQMIRMPFAHHHRRRRKRAMYRIIAALFLLVASAAASSAQGLFPSVWQSQQGALLKVLWVDPATGNFGGVFITRPAGPCPAVPADLAGRVRGPRVAFQTSRTWTLDCRVTAVWFGRFISPTTLATRWIATSVAPNGRVVRTRGTEVFQRI